MKIWGHKGDIIFKNYTMKIKQDSEPILQNLDFKISSGQTVCILGKNIKNFISLALTRVVEAESGQILIDGQPIDSLGLADLRDKICVLN